MDRAQTGMSGHVLPRPVLEQQDVVQIQVFCQLLLPADLGWDVGGWGQWVRRRWGEGAGDRSGRKRPPDKAECSPHIFCWQGQEMNLTSKEK